MEDDVVDRNQYEADLKQIRIDYNRAKRLLSGLQAFEERFLELKGTLEDSEDGIEVNVNWIKRLKDEILEYREGSKTALEELNSNLQRVKGNLEVMQNAYSEFTEVKGRMAAITGEIDSQLNSARSLKVDIEKAKSDSLDTLEAIKSTLAEVQGKIQNMQSAYEEFLSIKAKIDDDNSGLNAIFKEVKELHKQSTTLNAEIRNYKEESKKVLASLQKDRETAESYQLAIKENLDQSNIAKEDIQKIAALVSDTGFANSFQKRAKQLFYSYLVWGAILIISVLALASLLYFLFVHNQAGSIPSIDIIAYRITLTSPLLLLIVFSIRQYVKERNLNERYEFKAATAAVIRNHLLFLLDHFEINEPRVSLFVFEAFSSLYEVPYEIKAKDSNNSPVASSSDEMHLDKDTQTLITDLSEMIDDKGSLKKVLELIFRITDKS